MMKRSSFALLALTLVGCGLDIGYHFPTAQRPRPSASLSPSPSPSPSVGVVAQGGGNVNVPKEGGKEGGPVAVPTHMPDSLPFTLLTVPGTITPGEPWRFRTQEAFTAFLDANKVPAAGRPAVNFAILEVVAAVVMGGACQGTVVVGLIDGDPMKLVTAPYDQGCQNAVGPRPFYAFLAISRTDKAIEGVKDYTP